MSRNSKNARLILQARQMSAQRKNGNKGPSSTGKAHGKRNENCIWYQKKFNLLPKKRQQRTREVDAPISEAVEAVAA